MKYFVSGRMGLGFSSIDEAIHVLEDVIMPTFDYLLKLQKEKKIVEAGLPVGDRAFIFIAEASSNEELDRMLRKIPAWPMMQWNVEPLEPVADRQAQEKNYLQELLASSKR